MAAKKKSAPKKSAPKAKPSSKNPVAKKAAAKSAPAKAKPAKAADRATRAKPTKTAKPVKAAKADKPVKAAKAAPPPKPTSSTKAKAAPKPASPAKANAAPSKPAQEEKSSLVKTVKRAAAKVAQVAAQAAIKVLDGDMGRPAPAFELENEKGETVSSADLAGKPYLLYFYPKDDTPGCTKEACDIRDNFARFGQRGLKVFGVSPDSTKSHAKFGQKYGLPFPLLSDPEKSLATAYGVWGEKSNYGKKYMGIIRSSFLVGGDGVIKKAYRGVRVDGHITAVLEDAAALL